MKMFNFLISLFVPDPRVKLERKISKLYEKSVYLQRNGDLRSYGKAMLQIEQLEQELSKLIETEQ
tara:strand:+ start:348 stop:542 length:195 start_codon:yes stop_codon:yes gene_type:complete